MMKKVICVILSSIIVLSVFVPCFNFIRQEIDRKDINLFCSSIMQLNKKYESGLGETMLGENRKPVLSAERNRLIVMTENNINDIQAVDCLYGLGYAILQYNSRGEMLEDYADLQKRGYLVETDKVFHLTDYNDVKTESIVKAAISSSNYSYNGADYAKKVLQNNVEQYDEVVVGVIDTGIDYNHEIFENRYVDNRINFSTSGDADNPMDDHLHGTAVSSIVIQSTPNNVKVKPYKVANRYGEGSETELIAACEYILAEKEKPDILNISLGIYAFDGTGEIINSVIEKLVESGITICVSAGNENVPSEYIFPGSCDSVITVSSHSSLHYISDFSDYGKAVDVCAPGEKIYCAKLGGGYTTDYSGTSFSSPFACAAAAYVLMQNPTLTPNEVKKKIKDSAVSVGDDDSYYFGSGVLSFANLIDDYKAYDTPQPSIQDGLYHDEQIISFDNIPDGTNLVYTTNRILPSADSATIYTGPITVSKDTILMCALVKDGNYVSNIASHEYIIQYYADESDFTILSGVITKYNSDKTNIIVPDKINGKTPTSILRSVFNGSSLTSIVLPDSITTLGTLCFANSKKLKHIVANGITTLSGESVFSGCIDLRDESMPNLTTVSDFAFYKCKKLHTIDFEKNITRLRSSLFSDSGLLYGNFPNAKATVLDEAIFKGCTLFTCNIPNINTLYKSMFESCNYLYDLKTDVIKTIHSKAISYCYFLDIDVEQVNKLYDNALYGCYIDTFYAPDVTEIDSYSLESTAVIGKYCNIRVLDLPSLKTDLISKSICYSFMEELYLDNVTQMTSKDALYNMPKLNIVYLPNIEKFYYPSASLTSTEIALSDLINYRQYLEKPPLEIVWIPKSDVMTSVTLTATKLFFAPGTSSLNVNIESDNAKANIVVSDKITEGNLTVVTNGLKPVVIAQDESYVKEYAKQDNCGYTFVSADDCIFNGIYENHNLMYTAGENQFYVPLDFVSSCWDNSSINKTRNESLYEFILDFTNDRFINAKDYSVLFKLSNKK